MKNIQNEGPLARLLRGVGAPADLPPIPTPKRIDVMPMTVGIPVSAKTPRERICPTCQLFEREGTADLCPRCTLRNMNRAREAMAHRNHVEAVYRELQMRRLDQLDPDWRDHHTTFESAELAYRLELQKLDGDTVDCGHFEPRDRTR
jgi:hypothetical protein